MPENPFPEALPGRTIFWKGRECLYFSGTGYLGMHADKAFLHLVQEGLTRYGGHFGGSRLSHIQPPIFETAENYLSEWANAESAIVLSSGTLAGQLTARFFAETHQCHYAPGVHPALWGPTAPTDNTEKIWIQQTLDSALRHKEPLAIFANALDPLMARQTDFSWIEALPCEQQIILVLDDSHGFGITGRDGGGIYDTLRLPAHVTLIVTASLGKAPGIPAGVILGPKRILQRIRESPLYGGASPPTPAFLHALTHSRDIYRRNRERLLTHIRYFTNAFPLRWSFQFIDDYPVFYTPDPSAVGILEAEGMIISCFSYPRPGDKPISRIILNALHTDADVQMLANACKP
jgi:8-amino-7-oxononanoate synthase